MHVTRFTIRTPDGVLLDQCRVVDAPDFANQRIARVLKYHPDAVVEREDRDNVRPGRDRF